jgi:succinate dehydrogenase / fumarate reductase flavoprotein subunit
MIDILIIGSGGAGLSAALEAKKSGKNVLVVSKTYPTQSQTAQAQGGINGVLEKENSKDTIESHIADTLKSAHHIGDEKTISFMCEKASETIKWLDDIGVPFSRDENNTIAQRKLGGAAHSRACYSSDYTGLKILHTLYDNCLKENIQFLNEMMLLNFIIEDDTIKGITTLDIQTCEVNQILAKSVIVASGGYGALYEGYTTNSNASTGDAIAAALRANVAIANMEYVQFHPTTLKENSILLSESARGEGGYLVTADEQRFVDELASRDIVARAIDEKIQSGFEVFLDLRHLGLEKIKEVMPQEYDLALQFGGLKLDSDLIPIKPAAHYTMGGIKTNMACETNIKNLYAVGECSSNGVHGANRLGGNSLLEIITFGRYVGKIASDKSGSIQLDESIKSTEFELDMNFIENIFSSSSDVDFYPIKKEIGALFYNNVGLFRSKENLNKALEQIELFRNQVSKMGISDKSKVYNTNLKEYIEFLNMLELGDTIIISALNRCESRGAHYRVDYPSEDESFAKDSVVVVSGNEYKVELV